MKLRNKKTGEIIDLSKGSITDVGLGTSIQLQATDRYNKPIWNYKSLAELNEVWEDYEFQYIMADGCIDLQPDNNSIFSNGLKEIGNYFGTVEEAEKAVEKLKAWKRLKDNGFRIEGIRYRDKKNYIEWSINPNDIDGHFDADAFNDDLHLLFGDEE